MWPFSFIQEKYFILYALYTTSSFDIVIKQYETIKWLVSFFLSYAIVESDLNSSSALRDFMKGVIYKKLTIQ